MKCPRCNFVASNKKDVCPRCEFDLRSKKRELGLPIYNSQAPVEQLVAESRAQSGGKPAVAPQPQAEVRSTPKEEKGSLWRSLFGRGKKVDAPVAQVVPPHSEPQSEPQRAAPPVEKTPTQIIETDSDPLLAHLEALEKEIASASSAPAETAEILFSQTEASLGAVQPPSPAAPVSNRGRVPRNLATPPPAEPGRERDLAELISALDQLEIGEGLNEVSLFPETGSSIEESLDEIIHALDDLAPEQDLDDIELFQTKLEGLTQSLTPTIEEAKSATVELSETLFDGLSTKADTDDVDSLFNLDSLSENDLMAELNALTPERDVDEDAGVEEASELDALFSTPDSEPVNESALLEQLEALTRENELPEQPEPEIAEEEPVHETIDTGLSASPQVTPEVLEFSDDEELFDALDEMIGDTVLDVEAVKMAKPAVKSSPSAAMMTDDGMEISFEVEVEGAEDEVATEPEAERDESLDPLLSELMSTYENIAAHTQQHSIAPERPPGDAPFEWQPEADTPKMTEARAHLKERAQQLISKLSFLSEDILDELKDLVGLAPMESKPIPESAIDEIEISIDELPANDANDDGPEESNEEFLLSEEELRDLEDPVETDADPADDDNLEAMQVELANELAAMEAEGLTVYHSHETPEPDAAPVTTEPEASAPEPDLSALQAELAAELEALEAEGLTVYHDEHAETPVEEVIEQAVLEAAPEASAPEPDLSALQAELAAELEALEAEGLTVYHDEHAETPVEEVIEQAVLEAAPEASAPEPDLSALQAELAAELEALEAEGLTVYHDEHAETPVEEVIEQVVLEAAPEASAPEPDLSALQAELATELEALEAEGLTVYHDEHAETPVEEVIEQVVLEAAPEASAPEPDLSALQAELATELEALEAEGLTVYHDENSETPTEDVVEQVVLDVATPPTVPDTMILAAIQDEAPTDTDEKASNVEFEAARDELHDEIVREPLDEAVSTGMFLLSDLARLSDEPLPEQAQDEPETISEEHFEDKIDEASVMETESTEPVTDDAHHEGLNGVNNTGAFLVGDLARLSDEAPSDAEMDKAPENSDEDDEIIEELLSEELEEIDLADLARHFGAKLDDDEPLPANNQLDSAFNTGMFLASDLQKIIDAGAPASYNIPNEMWGAAESELSDQTRTVEVELSAGELTECKQTDALEVLFDLAEEELRDPNARRERVSKIVSVQKQVENHSLKQALTTFEKEERILSKRRAKAGPGGSLFAPKPIVLVPAPIWRRCSAGMVNVLLNILVSAVIAYLTFLPNDLQHALLNWQLNDSSLAVPFAIRFLGLNYLVWLVSSSLLVSGWGQTIGEHVMQVETVTLTGHTPDLKQAALRSLSQTTTLLTLGFGALPLLGKHKCTLHDKMSCTMIREKAKLNA